MMFQSTISRSVKYGLHFVGIWPGTPLSDSRKLCWLLSTIVCQFYQYKYMIKHYKTDDLVEMIYSLSLAVGYTVLTGKLIVAWINHGVLREIISTIEDDCAKYAAFDRNNMISKTADISFRLTTTIPALYIVSVTSNAVGTLAIPQFNDSNARQLLINMDLPFESSQSPTYELVVTAQLIFQLMSGLTYSMFCALLLMTILHAGCVIDILCHIITQASTEDKGRFRFVAMRHQEIIVFSERIEQLFTYIALCQLLSNTLILCCLGFLMITALHIENGLPLILRSMVFYVIMCLEIFVYCFAGEYLNMKSKMMVDAIYESSWYDMQPITSRHLVLLILRSQKGLPLTFGKFSPLSLKSFANILKASASYMSVLLAMS